MITLHNHNLYDILNIPEDIILDQNNNINYWISLVNDSNSPKENLRYLNCAVKIINKFHSYFHFEQSFAYTICAYISHLKNDKQSKQDYLTKAIFQDHINYQAKIFDSTIDNDLLSFILSYDKNHKYEKGFLNFAVGEVRWLEEIELLDKAIDYVLSGKVTEGGELINNLAYNSHRLQLTHSVIAIVQNDLTIATSKILETVKILETGHQNYHQFAASIYSKRAAIFDLLGQIDLSKNDRIKSKDLFPSLRL